jgi:tetratricopeptide (TPR) repeat protein
METAKPRAPLDLSLVEIELPPEDAANAASAGDPMSLESVTLQPYSDRRPKPAPAPAPPPLPSIGSLMLAPLDSPSVLPSGSRSMSPLDTPSRSPAAGLSTTPLDTPSRSPAAVLSMAPLDLPTPAPAGAALPAAQPSPSLAAGTGALDAPTNAARSGTSPMAASTISGMSRFLQEAAREYEAGRIDQPLWMRAAAQAGGDETVARDNYLRARATALKLARREQRGEPAARTAAAGNGHAAGIGSNLASHAVARDEGPSQTQKRKYVAIAAGAVVAVAAAAWWFGTGEPSPSNAAVAAAPRVAATAATAKASAVPAQPTPEDHAQFFGTKIQELKSASNWNVLVLYASDWTRKQPTNATAWKELAIGYSNMRQMDDALQAATKATALAPQDPAAWRMLAQVNVSLDQPAAALQAFEKAAALDDGDLSSWVQAGNLSTQLDRLPEARAAFDKVLAASPDHLGALCGKAQLAQRAKQPKEAEAIARQLKSIDGRCREADTTAVAVAAPAAPPGSTTAAPAPYKPVATRAR